MIDVKVTAIGTKEIAQKLGMADAGIRQAIRGELAAVGDEIVARAQANAPKRTGVMASRIAWYFGEWRRSRVGERTSAKGKTYGINRYRAVDAADSSGRIQFTVRPFGSVAHLMERGVNATVRRRPRRDKSMDVREVRVSFDEEGNRKISRRLVARGVRWSKPYHLRIAPRPFFTPAVEAAGGASGVNARLQARLNRFANALSRAP